MARERKMKWCEPTYCATREQVLKMAKAFEKQAKMEGMRGLKLGLFENLGWKFYLHSEYVQFWPCNNNMIHILGGMKHGGRIPWHVPKRFKTFRAAGQALLRAGTREIVELCEIAAEVCNVLPEENKKQNVRKNRRTRQHQVRALRHHGR